MRNLTSFLCLAFAVLLFSAGESFALPKCPGSYNQNTWTNCFGTASADGDKYVGEWRDGSPNGQGTYTWEDGSKYVGEYRDAEFHGQGTYTHFDGSKYVGEWRDDKRHGQGAFTYADGRVEEGVWKNGEFQYARKDPKVEERRKAESVSHPVPWTQVCLMRRA